MADATARFAVSLDEDVSGAADTAAGALDALEKKITADQKALKDLERTMSAAKKASFNLGTDYIGLAAKIQAKRNAVAEASVNFLELGGSFGEAGARAKQGAAAAKALGAGLAALGAQTPKASNVGRAFEQIAMAARAGTEAKDAFAAWGKIAGAQQTFASSAKKATVSAKPVGGALNKLGEAAKSNGPKLADFKDAIEGGGGAMPGFLKDLIEGTAALGPWGIAISVAVAAITGALAVLGAVGFGIFKLGQFAFESQEALEGMSQATINVAKRSPIAREEISKLSDELEKTGLKGEALETALDKAVKKKFGKAAEKSMMGLSVQLAKAKENAMMLFTGIKTDKLLDAAAGLFKFLDASTVEGQALQALLETLLNPILDGLAAAGPSAKKFFQGMIIGALMVGIAILTIKKRLEEITGIKIGQLGGVDWTQVGVYVTMAAVSLILLAGVIGLAIAGLIALGAAFMAIPIFVGLGLVKIGEFVAGIPAAVMSVLNFLVSRSAAFLDAGLGFAQGVADGISNGLSAVITAATEVAQGAIKAVKDTLQMHSPSKLGKDMGKMFTGSIAMGQEDGMDMVENAAMGTADAMIPTKTSNGAKAGGGAGAGGGIHIDAIYVQGVEGADDPGFAKKLANALEEALILAGFAPEPA